MLLPAVGCRADGEEAGATAAPAAPAPSVEDQYQKLLGSVAAPAASGADTYAAALGALVATDPAALYGADGKLPDEPTLLRILNNLLFLD